VELVKAVFLGTPHIAGYSLEGKLNALEAIYAEVCRFLKVPHEGLPDGIRPANEAGMTVPGNVTAESAIVRECVRQAYDIESDDEMLRKIGERSGNGRAEYFSGLRSGYRVRREFGCRTVGLLPEQSKAARVLQQLGFAVRVKEGLHV